MNVIALGVVALAVAGAGFFGGQAYAKNGRSSGQGEFQGRFQGGRAFEGGNPGVRQGGAARGQFGGVGFAAGEVLSADETTLTVKMPDGSAKLILLTSSTSFVKQAESSKEDIEPGMNVVVSGEANEDGSVTASNIQVQPEGATRFQYQN